MLEICLIISQQFEKHFKKKFNFFSVFLFFLVIDLSFSAELTRVEDNWQLQKCVTSNCFGSGNHSTPRAVN